MKKVQSILIPLWFSMILAYPNFAAKWTIGAPMPTSRSGLAAGTIGDKLYVVGGTDNGAFLNTLEIYDPATNTWTSGKSMPTARAYLAAVGINRKLYVVGGTDNAGYLNTLEIYDPATNAWTTGKSMPTARAYLAAVEINDKLYVVGGQTGSSNSKLETLEIYDPATNTWTSGKSMPTARNALTTIAIKGKIYAIGGWDDRAFDSTVPMITIEVYDQATNMWTTHPSIRARLRSGEVTNPVTGKTITNASIFASMPAARYLLAGAAINEKLYVVGGWDIITDDLLSQLNICDPEDIFIWMAGAPMSAGRSALAAAAINGKLYVVGGWNGYRNLNTLEIFIP